MPRFIIDSPIRTALGVIESEAKRRREITPSDNAIEALDFAAKEITTALAEAEKNSERLTAEEYAALHNVSPQIVRKWCRSGELAAERTANGWLIAHDAQRTRRSA